MLDPELEALIDQLNTKANGIDDRVRELEDYLKRLSVGLEIEIKVNEDLILGYGKILSRFRIFTRDSDTSDKIAFCSSKRLIKFQASQKLDDLIIAIKGEVSRLLGNS